MKNIFIFILLITSVISYSQIVTQKPIVVPFELNSSGNMEIPIIMNDVLLTYFTVDTGASESSIPLYIINTLIKSQTITIDDQLENGKYLLVDGYTVELRRVNIKRITIGENILTNVTFTITDDIKSPLLIGQNILTLFKTVQINNIEQTITFE